MKVFDGSVILFDEMPQRSIFGGNHFVWTLQCFKSLFNCRHNLSISILDYRPQASNLFQWIRGCIFSQFSGVDSTGHIDEKLPFCRSHLTVFEFFFAYPTTHTSLEKIDYPNKRTILFHLPTQIKRILLDLNHLRHASICTVSNKIT